MNITKLIEALKMFEKINPYLEVKLPQCDDCDEEEIEWNAEINNIHLSESDPEVLEIY